MIDNLTVEIQAITAFPQRSNYTDSNTYALAVELWLGQQKILSEDLLEAISQVNTFVDQANVDSDAINTDRNETEAFRDETSILKDFAYASANFYGTWNITTDLGGRSVFYNGFIYVSLQSPNVGNVPSESSLYWKRVTQDDTLFSREVIKTSNTGATDINKYTKIASVTLPAQYNDFNISLKSICSGDGYGDPFISDVEIGIKQHLEEVLTPEISIKVFENNIGSLECGAVVASNTFPKIVDIYAKNLTAYSTISLWAIAKYSIGGSISFFSDQPLTDQPTGYIAGSREKVLKNTDLSNSVASTSNETVATSGAVKTAYDKAVTAENVANGKISATEYATATTGGTLKVRLNGTTAYFTNNGNNA